MNATAFDAGTFSSPVFSRKTMIVAGLIRRHFVSPPKRLLVVGCGTGREAAQLAVSLGADVTGIDIQPRFDSAAAQAATLKVGDATSMEFGDGAFDFVYSYHALEHIPDFRRALAEMRRVLRPKGGFCIGTPNRHRVVSYLGSENTSAFNKLLWNAADWKARLRGKFRNEFGAHAGFTRAELKSELTAAIGAPADVTLPYYLDLYSRHQRYVRMLNASGLAPLLFPCVYFLGRVS
jgi:SAM-dependent methyltransferase